MTQGAVTWVEAASGFCPPGWGRESLSKARTRQARGYKALELYVSRPPGKSRPGRRPAERWGRTGALGGGTWADALLWALAVRGGFSALFLFADHARDQSSWGK